MGTATKKKAIPKPLGPASSPCSSQSLVTRKMNMIQGGETGLLYPVANTDELRLQSLSRFEILDIPPSISFDRITGLCSELFDCPIALVSLVDRHRQWFLSHHGLPARETPREMAFCNYVVANPEDHGFVVTDASKDNRFCKNPLVTGNPNIRFYAGAPLVIDKEKGFVAGSLCVISDKPRPQGFSKQDEAQLAVFASIVVELMNQHKETVRRLKERRIRFFQAMGHEMNNALHMMTNELQKMKEDSANDILPSVQSLDDMSHTVTKLARVSHSLCIPDQHALVEEPLTLVSANFNDILRDVLAWFTAVVDTSQVEYVLISDQEKPSTYVVDATKLRQLIENMLNIVTSEIIVQQLKNQRVEISLNYLDSGSAVIKVTGGLAPPLLENDYDCDLLSMNKILAKKMEVVFSYKSPKQEGSFEMELEIICIQPPAQICPVSPCCKQEDIRILWVEDEPLCRAIGTRILVKQGLDPKNIEMFEDGCLVSLDKVEEPTIVFLDIVMRTVNGDVLCREMREYGWTCPIIATTGNATDHDNLIKCGFDKIIRKPFGPQHIKSALAQFVKPPE